MEKRNPSVNIEIVKKQRKFAVKGCIVVLAIISFCVYLTFQDMLCTEKIEAVVNSSVEHTVGKYRKYVSTEYTYVYANKTYTDTQAIDKKFDVGDYIEIYINPNRPSVSTVNRYDMMIGEKVVCIWMLLGIILCFFIYIVIKRSLQIKKVISGQSEG